LTIEWDTDWMIGRHNNQMKVGVYYWKQTLGNDKQQQPTTKTTNNNNKD
jgi:hypothetical protein